MDNTGNPVKFSDRFATRFDYVPVTFLGVMALLLLALGWLGFLLLDQDLSLKQQRIRERIDSAAIELEDALILGLAVEQQKLNEVHALLSANPGTTPFSVLDEYTKDMTVIDISANKIMVIPESGLRYVPVSTEPARLPPEFAQADQLEFLGKDDQAATRILQPLALSQNPLIKAAALMRLGRIDKRNGRIGEALASYEKLVGLGHQTVNTAPASWLALYARCSIFEAENQMAELGVELERLLTTLAVGGYRVSKTTYQYYAAAAAGWAKRIGRPGAAEGLLQPHWQSEMAAEFFSILHGGRQGDAASSGISLAGSEDDFVLGFWTVSGTELTGGILPLEAFHAETMKTVTDGLKDRGIGWSISNAAGQILLTSNPAIHDRRSSQRSVTSAGTVFTTSAFETPGLLPDPSDSSRRRLLLTGLLLVLVMLVTSTYVISRSLRREARISRLQSDFVAAVSHEFRTPLTSIRQLTEMLASGRIENMEKAAMYYQILEKETARLQRLVEGLLDFGRMEAGAHRYQPEPLDCGELLNEIVTTFRDEYGLTAKTISLDITGTLNVVMDREALTRAIWNLLDNAVKYSPEKVEIEVRGWLENASVYISVTDRGVGVRPQERAQIFGKFVRGSAAHLTNAKGTGMGLAMVRKIIEDQGGSISVQGNADKGSVFTIELDSAEQP